MQKTWLDMPPTPQFVHSLGGKESNEATSWFSIKHIYFTFIEYKNSEHTRIHHRALKRSMTEGGRRRTREEKRGVSEGTTEHCSWLVRCFSNKNKYLLLLLLLILLMQLQARFGMDLWDQVKTGTHVSHSFQQKGPWKKTNGNQLSRTAAT